MVGNSLKGFAKCSTTSKAQTILRSAVILKVLGKMVGCVGVKSPDLKIEIAQEAAKETIAAAEIQNPRRADKRSARQFEYRTLIAQARSQPAGRQSSAPWAASVRLVMWAMVPTRR